MRRLTALILLFVVLITAAPALASDILYSGEAVTTMAIRSYQDRNAESLGLYQIDDTVQVLRVEPEWLYVRKTSGDKITEGYVLRHLVNISKQLNPAALPYGAEPAKHIATMMYDAPLYDKATTNAATLMNLPKGARVSILSITNGWAKVTYFRRYGYVYMTHLTDLIPVASSASDVKPGRLIASYTTAYPTNDEALNIGRMNNIKVACDYLQRQLIMPGEEFSFNKKLGPYSGQRGYMESPILFDGRTIPGYGGGTCQVSTTMYNALLCLRGISILYRRAHGAQGAVYVPHGVDAAVGNASLDLKFRNDYAFPIMFETWAGEGILTIAVYRAASQ